MLTKEAKTVLYHMYKEYLVRRDNKVPRAQAKDFGAAESIHALLFLIGILKISKMYFVNSTGIIS